MPFGLKTVGSTFQRVIHIGLGPELHRNADAYMDSVNQGVDGGWLRNGPVPLRGEHGLVYAFTGHRLPGRMVPSGRSLCRKASFGMSINRKDRLCDAGDLAGQ